MTATANSLASPEAEQIRLQRENESLVTQVKLLELEVRKLKHQLWGKKSERYVGDGAEQPTLFALPTPVAPVAEPTKTKTPTGSKAPRVTPMGPKPLDPTLPRETIVLPTPELKDLICPETKQPRQPGFVEYLEVLARKPAAYYVKRFERTVFVSPAKTAPVTTAWPADVLPRARMHASVVAHIATAHFADHLPYYRIEQQLARVGVDLPRNCQVSLMEQLDRLVRPLVDAMRTDVLNSGYVYLDATPVPVQDPGRPGASREATLWAFRGATGTVWFEYQASKSPQHPDRVLKAANFRGHLQTDAASGLRDIGPPGQVIALGCHAHLRRYFYRAVEAGEREAELYLRAINRWFRLDRLAKHFGLNLEKRAKLRARHSVLQFDALLDRAATDRLTALPKSGLGIALHYLLAQQAPLRRCLTEAKAELSNNAVERAIRPLKIGSKNWIQIGHPNAGPRLANLFTVVENCRLLGLDPEAYLIDLIARLPDHLAAKVAELLPGPWAQHRSPAATSAATGSGAGQSR